MISAIVSTESQIRELSVQPTQHSEPVESSPSRGNQFPFSAGNCSLSSIFSNSTVPAKSIEVDINNHPSPKLPKVRIESSDSSQEWWIMMDSVIVILK